MLFDSDVELSFGLLHVGDVAILTKNLVNYIIAC